MNTFGYANQNSLVSSDAYGLWSLTFGLYTGAFLVPGPGFQVTFGKDGENGFTSVRVGFGWGGSLAWNPGDGGMPGVEPKDRSRGGVALSCSLKTNFSALFLNTSIERGVGRNLNDGESSFFGGNGANLRNRIQGIDVSASGGANITVYSGPQK